MVVYKCERCEKKFTQKSNYISHINRKFKCKSQSETLYPNNNEHNLLQCTQGIYDKDTNDLTTSKIQSMKKIVIELQEANKKLWKENEKLWREINKLINQNRESYVQNNIVNFFIQDKEHTLLNQQFKCSVFGGKNIMNDKMNDFVKSMNEMHPG